MTGSRVMKKMDLRSRAAGRGVSSHNARSSFCVGSGPGRSCSVWDSRALGAVRQRLSRAGGEGGEERRPSFRREVGGREHEGEVQMEEEEQVSVM